MYARIRNRQAAMNSIRRITTVDNWFAFYALEQLCIQADLRVLSELAEGLEALLENPAATGNDRLELLLRERFPRP